MSLVNDDFFGLERNETTPEATFECLTPEQINFKQNEVLEKVKTITGINNSQARALLMHFRWDAMRALDSWAEDPERICKKVGLPPPYSDDSSTTRKEGSTCQICFDELDSFEDENLPPCKHSFCGDCWKQYFKLEVKEMKNLISCPGTVEGGKKCNTIIDDQFILHYLSEDEKEGEELKGRYLEAIARSFVEGQKNLKWCPSPGCKVAVELKDLSEFNTDCVTCNSCQKSWCFFCQQDGHLPCTCEMMKEWAIKTSGSDQSFDLAYIATIARPCPNCKTPIQKNNGCNHMMCSKCHFHFCWNCFQKFGEGPLGGTDGYGNHKCNGFWKEDKDVLEKQDEFKRFEFYSDRFRNHLKSFKLETKLLQNSDIVVKKLVEQLGLSWISAQFYRKAIEQLLQCRTTLQLSYVFGYFRPLKKITQRINKLIFENLQLDLERHTEKLSDLLEKAGRETLDTEQSNPLNLGLNVGLSGSSNTTKKGAHSNTSNSNSNSKTKKNETTESSSSSSSSSLPTNMDLLLSKQEFIINQTRVAYTVRQALINAASTEVYPSNPTPTTTTTTTTTTQKTGKRGAPESKRVNTKARKQEKKEKVETGEKYETFGEPMGEYEKERKNELAKTEPRKNVQVVFFNRAHVEPPRLDDILREGPNTAITPRQNNNRQVRRNLSNTPTTTTNNNNNNNNNNIINNTPTTTTAPQVQVNRGNRYAVVEVEDSEDENEVDDEFTGEDIELQLAIAASMNESS